MSATPKAATATTPHPSFCGSGTPTTGTGAAKALRSGYHDRKSSPGSAERRFRAMGTDGRIQIEAAHSDADGLAAHAVRRIAELEDRWSRFRSDSEISCLNRERRRQVSDDTFVLVDRAVRAWTATGGRFDPTMQQQLSNAGYDRPFDELVPTARQAAQPQPAATCAGIILDRFTSTVWLPDGVHLDPGGIGKGLAADIVTAELIELGAACVLVNLGGDLRVRSADHHDQPWLVEVIERNLNPGPLTTLALRNAALASSTPLRRAWTQGSDAARQHHLIDPQTGLPNSNPYDLVTVIAADGWWAEAVATSLAASPTGAEIAFNGSATLRVSSDGTETRTGGFERYERSTP